MSHIATVRHIYAAFGTGKLPAILEHISEDCAWEYAYSADHGIPWLVPQRGRAGAAKFFQTLGEHLEMRRFEVPHLLAEGSVVVALASIEAVVKATGKVIREEHEPHVWHFDARGQVIRFRHAADTLQQRRALER